MSTTTENLTSTPRKTLLSTSNPFEQQFGYHRAVRRGPFIAVSGTTALKLMPSGAPADTDPISTSSDSTVDPTASKVHFSNDAHAQALHVLKICLAAVVRLGGKKEDIIRVRMFVADPKDCGVVGDAFREVLGTQSGDGDGDAEREDIVGAAATMIVVPGGFVDGGILVEIEVDALVA